MRHQPLILLVITPQVTEIGAVTQRRILETEILEVAR